MPTPARVPPELRARVFLGSEAIDAGLLTRARLRSAVWQPLFRDVYVHRDVRVTHATRAVGAAVLFPDGVVTGISAAACWGLDLAGERDDVEITRPPDSHLARVHGIRVRRARVDAAEIRRVHGIRVTSPAATALRLAGALPRVAAVSAVDRLAQSGQVTLDRIRELAAGARGPGSARARTVVGLADGLAESPQETRVRLLMADCGLPRPVAQYRVVVDGSFVARVDFAWPEQKVALEYDGRWHADPRQFAKDRRRLNRLREAGWTVVFVTAEDLRDPHRLVAAIRRALSAG